MAEFDPYLRCGRLVHGFIGAKCTVCRHEHLVAFSAIAPALLYPRVHAVELVKRHGAWRRAARTAMVTFI